MEALLQDLCSVSVTSAPNNVAQPHPKYSEFKRRSKEASQEKRREELLKEQKRRRDVCFDANRDLEAVYKKTHRPERYIQKDKYKMMQSEWLVDVPSDMTTKWNMLLCPEGKHVLIIAAHGKTKIMNKRRQEATIFHSVLPGGNQDCPHELTVLDGIWLIHKKTIYVLDMLCWAHHDIVDCEAEFRFFWLQSKFRDNPEMMDRESNDGYRFVPVESHLCEPALIAGSMSRFPPFPSGPKLDGVMFYHMEASYMMGQTTPLVGWLKGYMVPDLLGVPVAPQYLESRPPGLTLQQHIEEEEKLMKSRGWSKYRKEKMECDSSEAAAVVSEAVVNPPLEAMLEEVIPESRKAASIDTVEEPAVSEELMTT